MLLREIEIGTLFSARDSSDYDNWWGKVLTNVTDILMGFFIGVIAFPLTLGYVFPLAIPIICAMIVYWVIDETHNISYRAWIILMSSATLGWMLVSIVGSALGYA